MFFHLLYESAFVINWNWNVHIIFVFNLIISWIWVGTVCIWKIFFYIVNQICMFFHLLYGSAFLEPSLHLNCSYFSWTFFLPAIPGDSTVFNSFQWFFLASYKKMRNWPDNWSAMRLTKTTWTSPFWIFYIAKSQSFRSHCVSNPCRFSWVSSGISM